jgi:hypothetical protein
MVGRLVRKSPFMEHRYPELADSINTFISYFFKIHCNIIFPKVRCLRNKSLMSRGYGFVFPSVRVALSFVVSEVFPFISTSSNSPRNAVVSALIPTSSDFAGGPLRGWIMTSAWGGKMLRVKQCLHMAYHYLSEHWGVTVLSQTHLLVFINLSKKVIEVGWDMMSGESYYLIQILGFWTLSSYLYLKRRHVYFSKHNVSEAGPEIGTSSIDWTQLSRSYLKTKK